MKIKNIVTVLRIIFIFILASCAPMAKVIPTQTTSPTSMSIPAPSTSTITVTPIPSSTLIPNSVSYLSCADPVLRQEVKDKAAQVLGMTFDEYIAKLVQEGNMEPQDTFSPELDVSTLSIVFAGTSMVSLKNLSGSIEGDSLFCAYLVDDADTELMIPIAVAYVYKGEFRQLINLGDFASQNPSQAKLATLEDVEEWFRDDGKGQVQIGDVFRFTIQMFHGVNSVDQVSELDRLMLHYAGNVEELMIVLPRDYLKNLAFANTLVETAGKLDSEKGDVALIGSSLYLVGRVR